MIAAVILAAGSSRRLGQPKQLIEFAGTTLLQRAISVAIAATLDPVIVVVNNSHAIEPPHAVNVQILINHEHLQGMATSIHAGVRRAIEINASGVVIMGCDQPAVTAAHLLRLTAEPDSVSGSHYAGKTGIPAYFPSSMFDHLLRLAGDTGARDMLRDARQVVAENLQHDIDTQEDLKRARDLFG